MMRTKNIVIMALLIVILLMSIGYSAFASHLTLNGTAEIASEWDVKITDIKAIDYTEGTDCGEPQYTNTSATFNAKLFKPGDYVTYEVTIENSGTLDATLNTVIFKDGEGPDAIKYTTTEVANNLKAGEQTTFTIKMEYDSQSTEIPETASKTITGIIEYVQT